MPPSLSDIPGLESLGAPELWDAVTVTHILYMTQAEFESFSHLFVPQENDDDELAQPAEAIHPTTVVKFVDGVIVVEETFVNQSQPSFKEATAVRPGKSTNSSSWTKKDVALFYLGLRIFGEDFGRISSLVGTYDRRQVRNKYKKESKRNEAFVIYACKNSLSPTPSLGEFIESRE